MKFDELFKNISEAYPMAPNPNLPKQQNSSTAPVQNSNNQQQASNTAPNPNTGAIDPAVVDELVKAQDSQAVLQILQQKLGVK